MGINELRETRKNGKKATRLCPCGYADDIQRPCRCTPERIRSYIGKLSGPLLDRIDLIVEVPALAPAELLEPSRDATDWVRVRERIAASRQRQLDRAGKLNSELGVAELNQYCPLTQPQRRLLAETMSKLGLSARTTHRVIKVARTIADYEDRPEPIRADLLEAISYRRTGVLRGRGD